MAIYSIVLLMMGEIVTRICRVKPLRIKNEIVASRWTYFTTVGKYVPMKMEQTECSETLTYKIQTPENNPEESIQEEKNYVIFR